MLMLTPRPILGTATMVTDTMAMATLTGTTAMDTGAGRRGRRRPPPRLTPMPTPRLTLTRGTVAATDTLDMDIGMVTTGPTDTTGVKFYDINST